MSTIEKLLGQKQQLMEQLKRTWSEQARGDRATSREIETALTLLEPNDPGGRGE